MAFQSWTGVLNQGTFWTGAGTALATATTAALSPQAAAARDFPIQGGGQPYGWYVGQLIRCTARGFFTTVATAGTLTWLLRTNLNNSGTFITLATSGGLTTTTTVYTGVQWRLDAILRCTAIAATGSTVSTQGELHIGANPATGQTINISTADIRLPLPNASGETAASVDTTQLQGIQLACTQATSTCTVQQTQWVIEGLN